MVVIKSRIKAWLRQRLIQQPSSDTNSNSAYDEERFQFLLNEVSDLRIAMRALTAPQSGGLVDQEQTKESFSYQWDEITEGAHLLGDPAFEQRMYELLATYSGYSSDWFKGKKVLDAGCGMGRWSYAMCKLGADVTAVDQSASGIAQIEKLLAETPNFSAQQGDLLDPLPFPPEFDLVWCYGVTHHTGNTRLTAHNVARVVKPGGRLMLMIYGEPTKPGEFTEINTYVQHRRATQSMSFEQKKAYLAERYPENLVHGFFDAISPEINDLHRIDEIEVWLREWGFTDIRRTIENRNHHIICERCK